MTRPTDLPPKLAANVRKVNLIVPSDLLERVDNFRRHLPGLPIARRPYGR